jgi:hypothetical protein
MPCSLANNPGRRQAGFDFRRVDPAPAGPGLDLRGELAHRTEGGTSRFPQAAAMPPQWDPETVGQAVAAGFAPLRTAALTSAARHRPAAVARLVTILSLAPRTSSRRRPLTDTEVADLDRVLSWLAWLEPADATIIAGAALRMSPERLGQMIDRTAAYCQERHAALLDALTYALNKHGEGERPPPETT